MIVIYDKCFRSHSDRVSFRWSEKKRIFTDTYYKLRIASIFNGLNVKVK